MTRTLVADVTMSACGHAGSGRPTAAAEWPAPRRPAVTRQHAVPRLPCEPAVPPQQAVPRPGAAGTLYPYLLQRHSARLSGSSFDPGRDVLCILISPLPWHQWL